MLIGEVVDVLHDTDDRNSPAGATKINVDGIDQKIAALVGVTPDQIMINDMTVNPISKNALSCRAHAAVVLTRCRSSCGGRGRQDYHGFARQREALLVSLVDAPAANPGRAPEPAHADDHRYELRQWQP